jgi:hypothetical protein
MIRLLLSVPALSALLFFPSGLSHADDVPPAPSYVCHKLAKPPKIDGKLDDKAWKAIPWTTEFRDIEGSKRPAPRFQTHAKMAWDDQCLYIAAELEEPHVWATITKRDAVIFQDNDFEVFLDPDRDNHEYAELEVNAFGTPWDLLLPIPYRDGGNPMEAWNLDGLKVATNIQGRINDPKDTDKAWTVEIAIPWKALAISRHNVEPPKDGDQWHVNFSRVEWQVNVKDGKYEKVPGKPEDNWVWSPTGVVNIHMPERWGVVEFSATPPGTPAAVHPDPFAAARGMLHRIYHAETSFFLKNGRWAKSLEELELTPPAAGAFSAGPVLKFDGLGWTASVEVALPDGSKKSASIRNDSWFRIEEAGKK